MQVAYNAVPPPQSSSRTEGVEQEETKRVSTDNVGDLRIALLVEGNCST